MKKKISLSNLIFALFSIFWLMPLLLIVINSFKPYTEIVNNFIKLPESLSLDMYIETWSQFRMGQLLLNTTLYSVSTAFLVIFIAPMAAYMLARNKGFFNTLVFLLILSPIMVPYQSYMISLTKLVAMTGLVGTRLGYIIVCTGLGMPMATFMAHGFVKGIPIELEECASIDGAGRVRTYFSVIFPLLKPILITIFILNIFGVWNDVITNQLLIGAKRDAMSIQNALFMNFSAQRSDWEHALPGITMSTIPTLTFFVIMQKRLVHGITAGAVKG